MTSRKYIYKNDICVRCDTDITGKCFKADEIDCEYLTNMLMQRTCEYLAGKVCPAITEKDGKICIRVRLGMYGVFEVEFSNIKCMEKFACTVGNMVILIAIVGYVYESLIIPTMEEEK